MADRKKWVLFVRGLAKISLMADTGAEAIKDWAVSQGLISDINRAEDEDEDAFAQRKDALCKAAAEKLAVRFDCGAADIVALENRGREIKPARSDRLGIKPPIKINS